jgi:hypothetical protein
MGMSRAVAPERGNAYKAKLAACAFSAFFVSCLGPAMPSRMPEPPARVESSWAEGRCSLSGDSLSFSEASRNAAIRLDASPAGAESLICGEEFTVIIGRDSAVVSLGARDVLAGREMLGRIGGRFVPANSYSLSLTRIEEEGHGRASESLAGDSLRICSMDGRSWSIALSDPFGGWMVY